MCLLILTETIMATTNRNSNFLCISVASLWYWSKHITPRTSLLLSSFYDVADHPLDGIHNHIWTCDASLSPIHYLKQLYNFTCEHYLAKSDVTCCLHYIYLLCSFPHTVLSTGTIIWPILMAIQLYCCVQGQSYLNIHEQIPAYFLLSQISFKVQFMLHLKFHKVMGHIGLQVTYISL
jgi:hypothetical protein